MPLTRAARFTAGEGTGRGKYLSVGPWRAGRRSAQYEYSEGLTVLHGELRGWYKTVGLPPYAAAIFVSFRVRGGHDRTETFDLAPSPQWARFAVPIRRPPPGADSVLVGVGLSELTEGTAMFAGLTASATPYQTEFPSDPGQITRRAPPRALPSGEFYRIAERNGTWWLVSPGGKPLYSTGTDGPGFSEMRVGRKYLEWMRRLSFNSLGGWTNLDAWGPLNDATSVEGGPPLAAFRSLQTKTMVGEYDRLIQGNHAFPDPFDPQWARVLREYVRRAAAPVRGKPWFVGFFADNEINHRDLHRYVYTRNCGEAFRQFLERRYGNISALNAAWGTAFESSSALIAGKPDPVERNGRMYEDFRLFKREIVRRYVDTVLRVIREEDPGHLVFSNRFMLDDVTEWIDVLDLYRAFDAIAVNIYPANLSAGLNASERAVLALVHSKTGKPVIIPEWSVPALDSGLYGNPNKLDWSYREVVETQQERSRQAAKVTIDFYNLPYVIGAHWFIWKDIDNETRQANRGLFTAAGEPWIELQDALASVNRWIEAHRAGTR